ncbi:MAG TPA: hypothetical protein DCE42_15170 [Myxococcales bacterium]|nr:hypothetical protein [Deltaproteobacteria bacterium]MBU53718.1 hypothetical protein [Deltaproteobacteria bacterium]HAA56103.1 hypothetical protein [Myxococcales bacterium]
MVRSLHTEKLMDRSSESPIVRTIRQFFLFGMIGGSGIFVDMAVIVLCRESWGLDERIAAIPAFILAVTWNYELNRFITFKKEVEEDEIGRQSSYVAFVSVCVFGLLIRIVAMHFMIQILGMTADRHFMFSWLRLSYIASIVGIGIASVFNFVGSKFWAFRG